MWEIYQIIEFYLNGDGPDHNVQNAELVKKIMDIYLIILNIILEFSGISTIVTMLRCNMSSAGFARESSQS